MLNKKIILIFIFLLNLAFLNAEWTPPTDLTNSGNSIERYATALKGSNGVAVWMNPATQEIQGAILDYANNIWTPTTTFSYTPYTNPEIQVYIQVAIAENGNAVMAWLDAPGTPSPLIHTAILPAGTTTWISAADLPTQQGANNFDLGVDAVGNAVAVWGDNDGLFFLTLASEMTFGSGTWSAANTLQANANFYLGHVNVAVTPTGYTVAAWDNRSPNIVNGAIKTSFNTWTATSSQPLRSRLSSLDISPSGEAVLVYAFDVGPSSIEGATLAFNDTTWIATTTLSNTPASQASPSVSVDPNGNAVAVWPSSLPAVESAFLPAGSDTWVPASNNVVSGTTDVNPQVATDGNGNAYALWNLPGGNQIGVSVQAAGTSTWIENVTYLSTQSASPSILQIVASGNQHAIASWITGSSVLQASILLEATPPPPVQPPLPPTNFTGKKEKNTFVTQTDYINILTWNPSTDPTVIGYRLYLNGAIIAEIPAEGPFKITFHNRHPKLTYTYSLVSVNGEGLESTPVTVLLKG